MDQPALVRATALDIVAAAPESLEAVLAGVRDEDPIVRAAAIGRLNDLPDQARLERLSPFLSDPSRRVRIATANALAGAPGHALEAQGNEEYQRAKEELLESFRASAESASTALNHGLYLVACGDNAGALTQYRRAIALDQDFLPAVFNLSNLLSTVGGEVEAKQLLTKAIARHPEEGELHFSLGLLLAQMNDIEGAATALQSAARLLHQRGRVHYNYGLAAQQLGRASEAEGALRRAAELEPQNPEFVYGVATFYLNQERLDIALEWAQRLERLVPDSPQIQHLITEIARRRSQ